MSEQTSIRTEAVKTVLTSDTPFEVIKACRDLTTNELEFIRVYQEMNSPAPRARRRDAGTKRGPKVVPDKLQQAS